MIIETPDHTRSLTGLDEAGLLKLLCVYRSRVEALCEIPDVKSVALFRNEGAAAGASQPHPHTQLLALPIVSSRLACEVATVAEYFGREGRCATCDMLDPGSPDHERLLVRNAEFAAFTAFAPRFPYETWIVPTSHAHDFRMTGERQLAGLAVVLERVMCALGRTLGTYPFNLVLATAPVDTSVPVQRAYHWRMEIIPRLTTPSGFELGTGTSIVAIPPEDAAAHLRSALSPARASEQAPLGLAAAPYHT